MWSPYWDSQHMHVARWLVVGLVSYLNAPSQRQRSQVHGPHIQLGNEALGLGRQVFRHGREVRVVKACRGSEAVLARTQSAHL
jgi:hypothetical protein